MTKLPTGGVPMRSGVALWKILLVTGFALVLVAGRAEIFGEGGTWIAKAPIPTPRTGLAVGVVNGILYAVGGSITHFGVGGYTEFLSTVEAYNPSTNSWTTKAPLPTPRGELTVGVVDGIPYALGGHRSQTEPTLDTMDAYDPVRNVWTAKAPMPTPRGGHAVGVAKGTLYAVGGWGTTTGPTGVVEAYDPTTNIWTTKTPLPENRNFVGLESVNGILYAVGGVKLVSSGPDSPPCGFGPCFKFVDDPINYAFKPLP